MNSKSGRDRLARQVRACDPEIILAAAALCDGHVILAPGALVHAGVPREVVEHLTVLHRSNATLKGAIYVGGRRVARLRGVSGLALLRFVADALGVHYHRAFGRGTEAANIREALRRRLSASHPAPPAGT